MTTELDQLSKSPIDEFMIYWNNEKNHKTIALLIHMSALLFAFIVPLFMWIILKDKDSFIYKESLKSLNFNITMFLLGMLTWFESFLRIGISLSLPMFILCFFLIFKVIYEISQDEESDYKASYSFLK